LWNGLQTSIWYIVEQRIPPSLEWIKLTTDCKETEFQISKYSASKDYYFRVRAANEFGIAEPSMPAMIRKKEGILVVLLSRTRGCGVEGPPAMGPSLQYLYYGNFVFRTS